jgi:hypothetical protein
MANELGKRYECDVCGLNVLCIKPGTGAITCHDKPMQIQAPRKLPSSD